MPLLWHQIYANPLNRLVDLEVYRQAGRSVRLGRALYEYRTPAPQLLPFTYPPFPALLAVPLSLLSLTAAGWVWQLAGLLVLGWLVYYCFRPAVAEWQAWLAATTGASRLAARVTAVTAPMLLPVMTWLERCARRSVSGRSTSSSRALVVADCCVQQTRWPRGVLVGIATAIKLTPGLFVPYLWLSGRRRAAYVATATFAGCQLLAAVVIPRDSADYWTRALFESSRLGNNKVTANVSWRGALLRLHPPEPWPSVLLAAGVLLILVIGMSRALLASRGGAELAGVALVGLTSVVISPVSWDHHLIWLVPAFAVLVADPGRRLRLASAVALGALFYTRVPWWSAGPLRREEGIVDIWFRTWNLSFTIAGRAARRRPAPQVVAPAAERLVQAVLRPPVTPCGVRDVSGLFGPSVERN
jgi:alpha-1,2-mannosyltransferase